MIEYIIVAALVVIGIGMLVALVTIMIGLIKLHVEFRREMKGYNPPGSRI